MATTLPVCLVCTGFGITPLTLKAGKAGHKYRCPCCNAEYWVKVTKEPVFNNNPSTSDKLSVNEYCLHRQMKRKPFDFSARLKKAGKKVNAEK